MNLIQLEELVKRIWRKLPVPDRRSFLEREVYDPENEATLNFDHIDIVKGLYRKSIDQLAEEDIPSGYGEWSLWLHPQAASYYDALLLISAVRALRHGEVSPATSVIRDLVMSMECFLDGTGPQDCYCDEQLLVMMLVFDKVTEAMRVCGITDFTVGRGYELFSAKLVGV